MVPVEAPAEIPLLNFSFAQLGKNAWALFSHVFLQLPDIFFNSIPAFGPLYHVSIPFVFVGIIVFTIQLFREKNIEKQTQMLALWGFLVTGIWVGLITYEVNINRVNIIFCLRNRSDGSKMEKAVAGGRSCLWNQQYSVLWDLFYYLCGRKQTVL